MGKNKKSPRGNNINSMHPPPPKKKKKRRRRRRRGMVVALKMIPKKNLNSYVCLRQMKKKSLGQQQISKLFS